MVWGGGGVTLFITALGDSNPSDATDCSSDVLSFETE